MKKIKLLLLVTISAFIMSASIPTKSFGFETENDTEHALVDSDVKVENAETVNDNYTVKFFDNLKNINWLSLLLLLLTGGLLNAIRKVVKEAKDVKVKYLKYKEDGILDAREKDDLIKELGEVILAIDGVWMILKKIFAGTKKK